MSVDLATIKVDMSDLIPQVRKLVDDMLEECAKAIETAEVPEFRGEFSGWKTGYRDAQEDFAKLLRGRKL